MEIYTIGHSNHTWESFLPLLKQQGIEFLVDTRSRPVSSYAPFANIRTLPNLLEDAGIDYAFMGDSLGGKPDDPSCYDAEGKPDYRKMRLKDNFQDGIRQLLRMAENSVTALMCAEEDPSKCHRRLLIGPALVEQGVELHHIRADGSVQTSDALGHKKVYQSQLQGMLPLDEGEA